MYLRYAVDICPEGTLNGFFCQVAAKEEESTKEDMEEESILIKTGR